MAIQADNVPSAVELQDAVVKKHTAGGDTTLGTQSQNLNMGTNKIVGVVDPTANQDCATKKYVDDNIGAGQTLQQIFDNGQSITIADGDNQTLAIINNDTTNNPDSVTITNSTTSKGLLIYQTGVGANSKHLFHVHSVGIQVNTGYLAKFEQDNPSSTSNVVNIQNDGTGHSLHIEQYGVLATSKNALYVYSNAIQVNSPLAYILQDNTSSTKSCLQITNDGSGELIYAEATSSLGKVVFKNTKAIGQGDMYVYIDKASNGNSNGIQLLTGGTGKWVIGTGIATIDDNLRFYTLPGGKVPLFINQAQETVVLTQTSNYTSTEINNDGTGHALYIHQDGVLATGKNGLYVYSNAVQVNSPLVKILQDNASSTQPSLEIQHDGAEGAVEINATHASASHFRLTGDPANSTPIDGDLWFNGTNMKIRIGATTYNFDVTAE